MTPPPRHLRAVPDPTADHDRPHTSGDPVAAAGALETALSDAGLAPDGIPRIGAERGADAGAAFLAMVARAEKVAPIHADTARLDPGALLRMIGGVAESSTHGLEATGEAALERLAASAWDVVRRGAAENDPELCGHLVEICIRLGGMEQLRRDRKG